MSNVLPQHARAQMMRDIRARFLLSGSLVLSAVALVALLALTPAYFSIAIPRMSLANVSQNVSEEQRVQEDADREIASRTRSLLSALMPFTEERASIYPVIERALGLQPEGISIESIVYKSGTTGEITIVGTAQSREPVNTYREALTAEKTFESVSVPVSALVGASEGNFTMTLKGKF
jgi:Tfp pilus assembly protein PilN